MLTFSKRWTIFSYCWRQIGSFCGLQFWSNAQTSVSIATERPHRFNFLKNIDFMFWRAENIIFIDLFGQLRKPFNKTLLTSRSNFILSSCSKTNEIDVVRKAWLVSSYSNGEFRCKYSWPVSCCLETLGLTPTYCADFFGRQVILWSEL